MKRDPGCDGERKPGSVAFQAQHFSWDLHGRQLDRLSRGSKLAFPATIIEENEKMGFQGRPPIKFINHCFSFQFLNVAFQPIIIPWSCALKLFRVERHAKLTPILG
ncbi:hypothetical protein [Paracoccus aerodenitrificans]|uniref:hypothetical protein n=1 Tax=Paracoccus aerodenitrificans TaxID=3017781 RepID=UPI0022F0B67E|nr:hypothetical protein [Paracoccus aerodenitrificans]WBU63614.1 hypothetical protein PAE61_14880 [Paracoccus aerodenitrificans]